MIGKARVALALLLALAGSGIAGLLWLQHHEVSWAVSGASAICGEDPAGGESGCGAVNRSVYSRIKGVPVIGELSVASLGLLCYLSVGVLLLLSWVSGPEARHWGARVAWTIIALALLGDLFLFGVQAFALHAYCKLCIATYVANLLILGLLWPARGAWWEGMASTMRQPDARALMLGWEAASLALILALGSIEAAFHFHAEAHVTDLLGAGSLAQAASLPPPAPQPTPPATSAVAPTPLAVEASASPAPADAEELAKLRARVSELEASSKTLQETIDDPQKLEKYYTAKALKDHEAASVVTFNLEGAPALGGSNGPVQVVEFSDVLCPHCRNIAQAFDRLLPQIANRVTIHFKNYPLDTSCNNRIGVNLHPGACNMALGLICAKAQGKFEPLYKSMFTGDAPSNPTPETVLKLGEGVGVDTAAFQACLQSEEAKAALASDIAEAGNGGVTGTPTLFINGKKLSNLNFFMQIVDSESTKAGLPSLQSPPAPQPPPAQTPPAQEQPTPAAAPAQEQPTAAPPAAPTQEQASPVPPSPVP